MSALAAVVLGSVETAPAGGAETSQIVIGTAVIGTLTVAFLVLGLLHRSGRSALLDRAAAPLVRRTGLPAWAVLPPVVSMIGFLAAGPGFVWDVALHIDQGRDAGPFANPSHYGLIVGTFSFFTAGWLAICMPRGREAGPAAIKLARGWYAPAAGVAMLAAGSFSLLGFPLDDVWHNLFGQDVTLWGPTHLMMITGGLLHFIAGALLVREGRLAVRAEQGERGVRAIRRPGLVHTGSVALAGLTIAFQQEFGYGVPQFSLMFQPMLIALAAALVLVPVRIVGGRGMALVTAFWAIVIQGALTLIVVGLGESTLHFPLYAAEAVLVELAALAFVRRPYVLGAVSGVLIGTVGVLAEYGWSHVWMPLSWPAHVLPEAIALSTAVAVLGGVVGAFVAVAARAGARRFDAPPARAWLAATCVMIVALAVLATELPTSVPDARATVTLTDAPGVGEGRSAHATVRFAPSDAVEDADWLYTMAWQGREHRRVAQPLRRVASGVYETTAPIPVHGSWKALIRYHRGADMASVPVHLPADAAIPAPAVPAPAQFTRPLTRDSSILQRERKDTTDGPLWPLASAAVAGAVVTLLALILWTLARLAGAATASPPAVRTRATARRPGARAAEAVGA